MRRPSVQVQVIFLDCIATDKHFLCSPVPDEILQLPNNGHPEKNMTQED